MVLAPVVEREVADDRGSIEEGDRILLIAEDDPNFAQILLDLARDRGFKGLVANRADRALSHGARVPAHRRHARPAPSRRRRLDRFSTG